MILFGIHNLYSLRQTKPFTKSGSQIKVLSLLCFERLCRHCLQDNVAALLCWKSAFEESYTYCTIQKVMTVEESKVTQQQKPLL